MWKGFSLNTKRQLWRRQPFKIIYDSELLFTLRVNDKRSLEFWGEWAQLVPRTRVGMQIRYCFVSSKLFPFFILIRSGLRSKSVRKKIIHIWKEDLLNRTKRNMTNKTGKIVVSHKDDCTFSLILNILHKKTENTQPEVERRQLAPLGERECIPISFVSLSMYYHILAKKNTENKLSLLVSLVSNNCSLYYVSLTFCRWGMSLRVWL